MTFPILPALGDSLGLTQTNELGFTGCLRLAARPAGHDQVFGRIALAMSTSVIRRARSDVSRASAR